MNHARSPTAGLYFSHPACLAHDPQTHSPGHPDTPRRLRAVEEALAARAWPEWERREAPAASNEELRLIHTARHVGLIEQLCAAGGGALDPDTFVGERSLEAARRAAGAASAMARALMAGEAPVGFCAIRPSGHHAEADRAMGFCLFNNIAIAAAVAVAQLGARRAFVLDWDVHHGNGTAAAFYGRADVLFASIHQMPLYPGTGALQETGAGAGEGHTINLPVPPGSGEELWLSLLEHIVLPSAVAFEPDLVLISAGFDAHESDPLAACRLQTASFARMARLVRDMAAAAQVPLGVVLEGGYNPRALGECVRDTLAALGGEGEAVRGAPRLVETERAAAALKPWWPL